MIRSAKPLASAVPRSLRSLNTTASNAAAAASAAAAEQARAADFQEARQGMSGGYLLHQALVDVGVAHIFGYSGGANLPVLDAFHESPIEFVMNRSEQCCGHAAQGYAKATGKCGVVLTTSGPGLTNIITPLQDAKGDSVPLVALSGQVPTGAVGTDAFQECPAVELTRPCTKWSYQVTCVEEIPAVINEAFAVAMSGKRGPVHIDLPKDVMTTLLQGPCLEVPSLPAPPPLDREALSKVVGMLNRAQRPIIIAGQGAVDCHELVRELSAASNCPVTTTLHGMGVFDERDPLSLHMLGMHGSVYGNYAVQAADLILAIGSRFDDRTTGLVGTYAPEARLAEAEGRGGIVHFDIEKTQFGRVLEPTVCVEGDCAEAMRELIPGVERKERTDWCAQLRDWKDEFRFQYKKPDGELTGAIKTQQAIEAVYKHVDKHEMHDEVVVSTGVGNHQMMSCQFFRWTEPRSIITSGSLGTMGFGLPAAIGAAVGCPEKTVVLIDGDGSFNMTLNDLGTVMEHKLPIRIALMNDGRQQMVHVWQKLFFDGRVVATNNTNPDFVALAKAYGFEAYSCDSEDDLEDATARLFAADGPSFCEYKVQPDICLPMVAPGKALDDMFLFGEIDVSGDKASHIMTGDSPS